MTNFILQSLKKFDKLTTEQARNIFAYTIDELSRLESVLESLNVGLLVCDEKHKLLLSNKRAQAILRINEFADDGVEVWNLIKDAKLSAFIEHILKSGDKVLGHEIEFLRGQDAMPGILSLKILPLVREHRVTGSLIVADDVTERKKDAQKLHRIESLEILATLAAGIAHEIKNPLAAISIQIQLLKKHLGRAKEKYDEQNIVPLYSYGDLTKRLNIVTEEIDRLNRIVVDFLFAVRPMYMNFAKGNINKIINDTMSLLDLELKEKKIETILSLYEPMPLVDFDERFMKQALLNIINNAMEAMKNGGSLAITTQITEHDLVITISDTGCGISENNKSKIFEPYFTTKDTGTGLGLSLVFRIVREHSGEINVFSKEGEGAAFVITLPVPPVNRRLLTAA